MLLVTMPKFQRKTLIKCAGSQTQCRKATHMQVFEYLTGVQLRDERLGLALTSFIFNKTAVIAELLWWTNWMHVLTPIWRFCALVDNDFSKASVKRGEGGKIHSYSLVFLKKQHHNCQNDNMVFFAWGSYRTISINTYLNSKLLLKVLIWYISSLNMDDNCLYF